jgi:hypothetical protein
MKRKVIIGTLAATAVVHVIGAACAGHGDLADAVADVAGTDVNDAQAQGADAGGGSTILEAPCDLSAGGIQYARFDIASVRSNSVPDMIAVACGWPAGAIFAPGLDPAMSCTSMSPTYSDGIVLVGCGGSSAHAATARLRIRSP